MQVLAMLVVGLVVALQLPGEGVADCCLVPHDNFLCGNCYDHATPYCGVGDCNAFGCNCDFGCLQDEGDCASVLGPGSRMGNVDVPKNGHDVIRQADTDGDGKMSLEEAHALVADKGFTMEKVTELDLDNDQFLSAGEIDADLTM